MTSSEVSAFWRGEIDRRAASPHASERRAAAESEALLQRMEAMEATLADLATMAEDIIARAARIP